MHAFDPDISNCNGSDRHWTGASTVLEPILPFPCSASRFQLKEFARLLMHVGSFVPPHTS